MMTVEEAEKVFEDVIEIPCPNDNCAKPAGELCDTPGVWVHLERFKKARKI